MLLLFHAHHAVISDRMKLRAQRQVEKLARRNPRIVSAVVRFEQDGPTRRVEVSLHVPRRRDLVAEGRARNYGPALAQAIGRLGRQLEHRRRIVKGRPRRSLARA